MKVFTNTYFALTVALAALLHKPQTSPDMVRAIAMRSVKTKDNLILSYVDKDGEYTMREVEVVGYDAKHDVLKTRCLVRRQFRMFKIGNITEVRTSGRKTITPVGSPRPATANETDGLAVAAYAVSTLTQ